MGGFWPALRAETGEGALRSWAEVGGERRNFWVFEHYRHRLRPMSGALTPALGPYRNQQGQRGSWGDEHKQSRASPFRGGLIVVHPLSLWGGQPPNRPPLRITCLPPPHPLGLIVYFPCPVFGMEAAAWRKYSSLQLRQRYAIMLVASW